MRLRRPRRCDARRTRVGRARRRHRSSSGMRSAPMPSGAESTRVAQRLAQCGLPRPRRRRAGLRRLAAPAVGGYRLDSLVAGLAQRLVATLDLEPLSLMGHSWGGAIVVRYAAAHPDDVRALVLLDSGHIDYATCPTSTPTGRPRSGSRRSAARDAATRRGARAGDARLTDRVSVAWPVIAEHEIPTLLFLATSRRTATRTASTSGVSRRRCPHAEVRWVEGAGHGILADVGAPLGDEIAAWLVAQGALRTDRAVPGASYVGPSRQRPGVGRRGRETVAEGAPSRAVGRATDAVRRPGASVHCRPCR